MLFPHCAYITILNKSWHQNAGKKAIGKIISIFRVSEQTELFSATDVWIGKQPNGEDSDAIASLTCLQLYDSELTSLQLDKAANLCDHLTQSMI